MSDGSIGGGKYRRRRPLFSFFDNVFDCGGALSSSNCGRHRCGLVVSSSRGGVLLDPDGNNDEDDDDRSHQDHATGLRNGNVGAPSGDVDDHDDELRRGLQAGLR